VHTASRLPFAPAAGPGNTGRWSLPALPRLSRKARGNPRVGARKAFFRGRFMATPVYAGPKLTPGQAILGPAIVEEPFTTIVVYPGQRATVDQTILVLQGRNVGGGYQEERPGGDSRASV